MVFVTVVPRSSCCGSSSAGEFFVFLCNAASIALDLQKLIGAFLPKSCEEYGLQFLVASVSWLPHRGCASSNQKLHSRSFHRSRATPPRTFLLRLRAFLLARLHNLYFLQRPLRVRVQVTVFLRWHKVRLAFLCLLLSLRQCRPLSSRARPASWLLLPPLSFRPALLVVFKALSLRLHYLSLRRLVLLVRGMPLFLQSWCLKL